MGLKITTTAILLILGATTLLHAGWQEPAEILNGGWGSGDTSFGIESGDTSDRFASLAAILYDGRIVVSDQVNEREILYNSNGTLPKIVPWYVYQNNVKATNPEYSLYQYWNVQGYTSEGNVWMKIKNYILKSPTGQLIKTSTTRPLELGQVTQYGVGGVYKIKVAYPDTIYQFTSPQPLARYYRDSNKYFYQIEKYVTKDKIISYRVHKYTLCGKEVSVLTLPLSQYEPRPDWAQDAPTWKPVPIMEYGEPLVSSAGDVYAWARTKTQYKIVKWTWVDDPNVPSGPDAPTNLTVAASINGLYLTWVASPQDPGCVTGYEISRATSAGGVGSTIATVNAGVVKYNDTSASAGTTYYYKVRAVAGSEYSPYTAEVSGKR